MFFEGPEKKIEVIVKNNLLDFSNSFWEKLVETSGAKILSEVSNLDAKAYLLSESSLFVWKHHFLMITCGETTLINSLLYFIDSQGVEDIESVIFQRKNEYFSQLQKTTFAEDVKKLKKHLAGQALRFGYLDEHHNFMYHLNHPYQPFPGDVTTEILMYHIQGVAAEKLRCENQSLEDIRKLLNLEDILKNFQVDDYLFKPCGYSLNAINQKKYITVHITPQEDSSYVSFETNLNLKKDYPGLCERILNVFQPFSFDVIDFNTETEVPKSLGARRINHFQDDLACGYQVNFCHYIRPLDKKEKPVKLLWSDYDELKPLD